MKARLPSLSTGLVLLGALLPGAALAHTGHDHGLAMSGLLHPLGGLDHLLALLGVGMWAAHPAGRRTLWIPALFIASLVGGALLAGPVWPVAAVETGIAASVVFFGLLLAFALRLPDAAVAPLAMLFALCHGLAHGLESPHEGLPAAYVAGFMLTSSLLVVAGAFAARKLAGTRGSAVLRIAGAGAAASGLLLMV